MYLSGIFVITFTLTHPRQKRIQCSPAKADLYLNSSNNYKKGKLDFKLSHSS